MPDESLAVAQARWESARRHRFHVETWLQETRQHVEAKQREMLAIIADLQIPKLKADRLEIGGLCEKSSIDYCIYDMDSEAQDDECLFCGDPRERK